MPDLHRLLDVYYVDTDSFGWEVNIPLFSLIIFSLIIIFPSSAQSFINK